MLPVLSVTIRYCARLPTPSGPGVTAVLVTCMPGPAITKEMVPVAAVPVPVATAALVAGFRLDNAVKETLILVCWPGLRGPMLFHVRLPTALVSGGGVAVGR